MSQFKTRITDLLQIEVPVIQGGMAWVAEHHLAAAVSAAGGLGIIGAANAPADWVRDEIRKARELTENPIGVNVMLLSPYADEVAKVLVEEKVPVITTGAGNPGKYMEMWKAAGAKVIPVVASVALARMMERGGADAVIAEGTESGGHIGAATTMTLVPQVADAVTVPVIAAGGIGDGRGMAAAFMLGAEAVQIGTRFVVAKESICHPNYKERIIKAKDIDSAVTGRSHGHPIRQLRNQMTKEYIQKEQAGVPFEELELLTVGSLRNAVMEGDVKHGTVMAGQIAGMIKKEQTCQEIVEEIVKEAQNLMQGV
ncbi:MAG: enoyl-[acyl-carrier-protein] reductase FabK [Lachnospiraceae bacterium]|nr:enoyl-[acyl-carrier-protein] reductase FabK [Lachnospiraceae bacterium]